MGDLLPDCLLGIVFFCKFVNGLTERYPEIFDADHGDTGQHQIRFSKKWRAYATIAELANGNIKEIDGVIYMNDGDWVESCTALVEHIDGKWEIITWSEILVETPN